ncbi:hypothetical protein L1049_020380 [Liquidambar formosana]|uniref:Trafficking protein particle complex subunit n=1 Tax=Liquidambar formosana TaxID=63359 RepID=A0AAP0SD13_LIQFO
MHSKTISLCLVCFSQLKSLTAKMDPTSLEKGNLGVPQLPGQGCSFHSFRTNTYKLSFMESPFWAKVWFLIYRQIRLWDYFRSLTGWWTRFVAGILMLRNLLILVTHPRTGDLRESLKYIYNLYVEYVVKNPLYTPGAPIRCDS